MKVSALRLTAAAGAAAIGMALMAMPASAQEWTGWNIHPKDAHPSSFAMDKFVELVVAGTEGRIGAKVFHGGVLGSQSDAIEQLRLGAIQFANFNVGPMGKIVPETNVALLPFVFKSVPHMFRAIDGAFGDELAAAMEKKGLKVVGWVGSGARSFYNTKRPITKPADLKGLKIRTPGNPLWVGMVEAMGGNATPMNFADVFQSIKTKVLDGGENNFPSFVSAKHHEVSKFLSLTEHMMLPECICVSTVAFNALSAADQKVVMSAGKVAANLHRKLWDGDAAKARKEAEDSGVIINEIPDKSAFQAAMKPVYAEFLSKNPDLASLIDTVKAID